MSGYLFPVLCLWDRVVSVIRDNSEMKCISKRSVACIDYTFSIQGSRVWLVMYAGLSSF
jgi:hypothetical protein